jgi:hypothetical protein
MIFGYRQSKVQIYKKLFIWQYKNEFYFSYIFSIAKIASLIYFFKGKHTLQMDIGIWQFSSAQVACTLLKGKAKK